MLLGWWKWLWAAFNYLCFLKISQGFRWINDEVRFNAEAIKLNEVTYIYWLITET